MTFSRGPLKLDDCQAHGPGSELFVVARRYRGLAAIEPSVLAATCVAPASRRTSRVSAAQAAAMIGMLNGMQ